MQTGRLTQINGGLLQFKHFAQARWLVEEIGNLGA
jgi:hypothetical protein